MNRNRHSHNALPGAVGELELLVMESIWANPGSDAKAITRELAPERYSRLSTIQSTLERLVRKNFLRREKKGHAYFYFPSITRSELLGSMLKDVISLLHDGKADTILSSFVNVAARLDSDALDEMEALIRKKRREADENNA